MHRLYVPQVGCIDSKNETFWEQMDQELGATLQGDRVIVDGCLNWHVRRCREGIETVHGGWGVCEREAR